MSFHDEQIQALLNQVEQAQKPKDIRSGPVLIGDESYEFVERAFFEDKLTMYLPATFEEMPVALQKIKYPYEQRPEIVLSNEPGTVNLTLNRVDQKLQDEWVQRLTSGMKAMLQKMQPANVFYGEQLEEVNGKSIGYFDFKSPALDEPVYHNLFYFELEGETVMGSFNCPYRQYADWRDIVVQVIRSIRTVQEEEEPSV
ncbi:hypothetical protein J2Z22_004581 [Paenibacillus forsythiae]|uniref:DUF1795 domain-containing protein n=1 Tax=Paenibacillus forsythiae TaxID=365616 RepID=A0ABU3HH54_9BACL|nr:hypothetical protein [Paenibacillus forsythiae]MDT3428985.1 hypothetical protein [Paenibacillus forsythiae]